MNAPATLADLAAQADSEGIDFFDLLASTRPRDKVAS
jgi:hypothetical protein